MKIAIPVNQNNAEANVNNSFGRAPYFYVYNLETKTGEYIDNAGAVSTGGAGIKAAQSVVDSGAKVILTPRCGKNSGDILVAADIKLYQTKNDSVKENLAAYEANELAALDEFHAGHHGSGGK